MTGFSGFNIFSNTHHRRYFQHLEKGAAYTNL